MWSILIVDDHVVVRRGLAQILREELQSITFSEAATAAEALLLAQNRIWDLIILGTSLPGKNGLELLPEIRRTCVDTQILMLGVHSDHRYASQSMRLGASGYVSKDDPRTKLVEAIQSVLARKRYVSKLLPVPSVTVRSERVTGERQLSSREREVLAMLATGKSLTEIAAELNVSCKTVSTHKKRLFDKMHWASTVDMVRFLEGPSLGRHCTP
jgi:DNA-binding NarL/FixJ family response regulator